MQAFASGSSGFPSAVRSAPHLHATRPRARRYTRTQARLGKMEDLAPAASAIQSAAKRRRARLARYNAKLVDAGSMSHGTVVSRRLRCPLPETSSRCSTPTAPERFATREVGRVRRTVPAARRSSNSASCDGRKRVDPVHPERSYSEKARGVDLCARGRSPCRVRSAGPGGGNCPVDLRGRTQRLGSRLLTLFVAFEPFRGH